MNGVIKRGVFEIGLCDVPQEKRKGLMRSFFAGLGWTMAGMISLLGGLWVLATHF